MKIQLRIAFLALGGLLTFVACKPRSYNENSSETKDISAASSETRWIYNGPMPALERPRLTVSQATHTVRVTGLLPKDFDEKTIEKFSYIKREGIEDATIGKRTRVQIVYPISTGHSANATPSANLPKGTSYDKILPIPYRPFDEWDEGDVHHATNFGGFPFLNYVPERGIAFHGPIEDTTTYPAPNTMPGNMWRLRRGMVSMGCNRMQGEHVVELASMIGIDTKSVKWAANKYYSAIPITTTVIGPDKFDAIGEKGQFYLKNVTVDYPAVEGVREPTENVLKFDTWDARDHPTWVCEYRSDMPAGADKRVSNTYCDYKIKVAEANKATHRICHTNGKPIDVFNINSKAYENEPVKLLGGKDAQGRLKVLFLTTPVGTSYVSQDYLCNL